MAISVLIIALVTYCLGLPDMCELVSRYILKDDIRQYGPSDYPHVLQHFRWRGIGYTLFADMIRALVIVLIGGMLMKRFGFPGVGKATAMFFALYAQCIPPARFSEPRQDLVFPALLLLFTDWKLLLICAVFAVIAVALTGSRALMVLAPAVAFPLFTLIFGNPFIRFLLALGCGFILVFVNRDEILDFFENRKARASRAPRRESDAEQDSDGEDR